MNDKEFDIRVIVYPIITVIVFFIFATFIVPWFNSEYYGVAKENETTYNRVLSIMQWTIMFSSLWLLYVSKYYRNRKIQIIAFVFFVQGFLFNYMGFHYKYDNWAVKAHSGKNVINVQPDVSSNTALGTAIAEANNRGLMMLWDPYIFCGMPAVLIGSALSQAQGMAKKKGIDNIYGIILYIIFFYVFFRWNKTKLETKIAQKWAKFSTESDRINGDGSAIALVFCLLLVFMDLLGPLLFLML